jgi:protein tyrosine/serine phosphatase
MAVGNAASGIMRPGRRKARRWHRRLLLVSGSLLVAAGVGIWGLLGENFHTVLPGQVYRSAQLSPAGLHDRILQCHLRSVLNLRGANPGEEWYDEECEETAEEGVRHYDLSADSEYPPQPDELRELIALLDRCDRPLLIHCQSGIDRTGVTAAICVLLSEGGSLEQARAQLGLFCGGFPWAARTLRQKAFLAMYEAWLAQQGYPHSPARFRQWALHVYTGTPGAPHF